MSITFESVTLKGGLAGRWLTFQRHDIISQVKQALFKTFDNRLQKNVPYLP